MPKTKRTRLFGDLHVRIIASSRSGLRVFPNSGSTFSGKRIRLNSIFGISISSIRGLPMLPHLKHSKLHGGTLRSPANNTRLLIPRLSEIYENQIYKFSRTPVRPNLRGFPALTKWSRICRVMTFRWKRWIKRMGWDLWIWKRLNRCKCTRPRTYDFLIFPIRTVGGRLTKIKPVRIWKLNLTALALWGALELWILELWELWSSEISLQLF